MDQKKLTKEQQEAFNRAREEFIEELGIESLPAEQQEELLAKMSEALIKDIMVRTLERLGDADKEAYSGMLDQNTSPEEMDKFLKEKIPDYEEFIQKIITDFKEEMKNNI